MSVGAILPPKPPFSKIPRSNPCVNLYLPHRTKVTKGFHLTSPQKQASDLPREPLQGRPLLSRESSQLYGPCNTPRQECELVETSITVTEKYVVNPYTECDDSPAESSPLTLFGERLNKKASKVQSPSSPILRTRLRDEVKTLRQKYSETQRGDVGYSRLISFSPDCLSRGSMSPLVSPASPHSFGVDQSFSVDGQHINCDGASRSASTNSKDFNPGFIKRPRYCCGKCELRMLEHESLNMDSECPFQAYQRQTKSSLCYTSDVMSHYYGPDIDPYVYYESPWDTQKEDYTLYKRSKSVPATIRPPHFIPNQWSRHLTQNQMFPKHGSFDAKSMSSSSSSTDTVHSEENLEDTERYLQLNTPEPEDGGGTVLQSPAQNANHYHRNHMYTIPRLEEVNPQYGKSLIHEADEMETEKWSKAAYGAFHWKESWNIRETRVVALDASLHSMNSQLERSDTMLTSAGERQTPTNTTCVQSSYEDEGVSSPVAGLHSSEDLHDLLQGCVHSFRNLSNKSTEEEERGAQDNPSMSPANFANDLRVPTDICYQPITDKRYNRWKRTKRKGKGLKFSVASDDSDEEKVPENSSPRGNRRRKKKTSAHTSPRFEASSNDASSEPLSDMVVDSVHSQHYNSLRSSSTESRERYLYQDGAASNKPPSWSSEDEEVPGVLTSFPALNNYHASVHGISNAYKIHRSTPEIGSTLSSPPSQDNTISMSKSPDHQKEDESSKQKRNVDGSEQNVDSLQCKTVDSPELKKVDSPEWKRVDSPEPNTVDSKQWKKVDCPEQRVDISEEKNKDISEQESKDFSSAGIESPGIEVPLVSKEDLATRKSPTYSSSLGSSNSYSTNKSNSRFSNSLAKDTLVRMSYSIGEKIVKSMAVVPVTYGRKDIDVFKKNKPVPKTQKINPKAVPDQASKRTKDSTLKSLKNIGIGIGPRFKYPIINADVIRPQHSHLTLNHLLQTMPPKTSSNSKDLNKSLPKVKYDISLSKNSKGSVTAVEATSKTQLIPKKKNFGIQRKIFLASKFPSVVKKNPSLKSEVQSSPKLSLMTPAISNLDFTPAFTFSMFELPRVYKDHNTMLMRRASGFK